MAALFCLATTAAFTQTGTLTPTTDDFFKFKVGHSLVPCTYAGTVAAPAPAAVPVPGNAQFKIEHILGSGDMVVSFLKWPLNFPSSLVLNLTLFNSTYTAATHDIVNTPDRFFILSAADFQLFCARRIPKTEITFGIVTLPIKMRFGSKEIVNNKPKRYFDFGGDVSLGISGGLKFNKSKNVSKTIITGIAISSVPVDSFTTHGVIQDATNVSAITWHLGFIYQYRTYQFGIFTGFDFVAGETGRQWVYKGMPWLGIGLGLSIFNANASANSEQNNK